MIESLVVKNLESHKNTQMDFHQGVNVIVGETDSGKSAIMRAFKLVIKNRPAGDGMLMKGEGEACAEIVVGGQKVQRIKGKENLYRIGNREYRSFGQTVPDDVQVLLNMGDLNMKSQLEMPFLLDSSSGEVSKFFNSIIRLDVIDEAFRVAVKDIRQRKWTITMSEKKKAQLLDNEKEYDWLVSAEDQLREVELLERSNQKLVERVSVVQRLCEDIENKQDQVRKLEKLLPAEKKLKKLEFLYSQVKEQFRKIKVLQDLIERIQEREEWKDQLVHRYQEDEKRQMKLHERLPSVCPLCGQSIDERNGEKIKSRTH